jgi:hypothetical protein
MLVSRVPLASPRFLVVLAMVMLITVRCVGLPFFGFLAGLGTSIGAPDHQEDSRKRHDA